MSPYLACMNTLCAWPSPDRLSDALVCLRQSDRDDDNQTDGKAQDMVTMEEVDQNDIGKKKIGRHPRRYWRFIGLRNDGSRIDAFIEKNRTLLAKPHPQPSAQQIHTDQQSLNQNQIMNQADLLPSEDVPGRVASHSNGVPQATKFNQFQSAKRTMRVGMMMTPFPLEHPPPMQDFQLPSKIFPRHQVSLGAGMRDLYQDAEIEANKREGEARAQRIMDTVGEDEPIINPHPSSSPMHPSSSNQSLDSNDPLKKANKKVKHRLKKLKDAFYKLTPSSMHSSPNRSGSVSPSYKHYSTALHGKTPKELGPNQGTVSRASSRTLPNRNLTQLLRGESRSAETVTSVSRRASLMP
ncbi:hypothetical protein BY996DRAFT_8484797 [Phakopsora pachyrhizi]|nr:hypothetical protein BY996DRAFT_8484797 [Phakopsora pachyrhizi]